MKKMIVYCVVLAILASLCVMPVSAAEVVDHANEASAQPHTQDEMKAMLIQYFPEYASRIQNASSNEAAIASVGADRVVINKTKSISDDEDLTYIEYASGKAVSVYRVTVTNTRVTTPSGSAYTTVVCNIEVHSLAHTGVMYISGFTYVLNSGGYDYISSVGTTNLSTVGCTYMSNRTKWSENSAGPAHAIYQGSFLNIGDDLVDLYDYCTLYVYVGNDQLTYSA